MEPQQTPIEPQPSLITNYQSPGALGISMTKSPGGVLAYQNGRLTFTDKNGTALLDENISALQRVQINDVMGNVIGFRMDFPTMRRGFTPKQNMAGIAEQALGAVTGASSLEREGYQRNVPQTLSVIEAWKNIFVQHNIPIQGKQETALEQQGVAKMASVAGRFGRIMRIAIAILMAIAILFIVAVSLIH